jgi:hypothetical protein
MRYLMDDINDKLSEGVQKTILAGAKERRALMKELRCLGVKQSWIVERTLDRLEAEEAEALRQAKA